MMTQIYNIKNYAPSSDEAFFIDANIWLYICYPRGRHAQELQSAYSNFMGRVKRKNTTFYTSSQVLSEVINRCIDHEFKLKLPNTPRQDKKRYFLRTSLYRESLESKIIPTIQQILKLSCRCSDQFEEQSIESLIRELYQVDFNDACHLHLVRSHNLTLVTHDSDFGSIQDDNLKIVTALPKLLRKR